MYVIRKNGSTSNILRATLRSSATGQGLTGLAYNSTGLVIGTVCDNEATTTTYTAAGSTIETITTLGTFATPTSTKCRFKEVDATNHPGLYEIQLDNTRFAVSSAKILRVTISGATNLLSKDVIVQLESAPADALSFAGQTITCAGGVTIPAATLASTTNITAGTITTTTNLTNERAKYMHGAVWIGTAANTNTVSYTDGIMTNPVSTIAAAKTIADNLGLKRFWIQSGASITLGADYVNYIFDGRGYSLALGGRDISKAQIERAEGVSGIGTCPTGEAVFYDCHLNAITIGEADFVRCHLNNTITQSQASVPYLYHSCVGVGTSAKITFNAASQTAVIAKWSGVLTIAGMAATNTVWIDGDGDVTFDGTNNSGATVYISGNIRLTNTAGITNVTDTSRYSEDQNVTNVTGNVTGSVGSVTGAVGSVTGNVGGNVVGSVASVTGAVGSVTGNVGGNVVGSVASVTGNVGGNVVGSVASVTGAVGSVTGNVGGSVASVTGAVGSVTGAVGSVTGNVGGNVVGSIGSLGTTAKADVNAEVDTALTDIHLDHLLAADYDPASKPGTATALLNELVENDSGVSRFTANALEQAPSGTGASAASIADAVWDEALSGHTGAGSAGEALGNASAAGDPWGEDIPGSYTSGQAGYLLGHALTLADGTKLQDRVLQAALNRDYLWVDGWDLASDPVASCHGGGSIPTSTRISLEYYYSDQSVVMALKDAGGDTWSLDPSNAGAAVEYSRLYVSVTTGADALPETFLRLNVTTTNAAASDASVWRNTIIIPAQAANTSRYAWVRADGYAALPYTGRAGDWHNEASIAHAVLDATAASHDTASTIGAAINDAAAGGGGGGTASWDEALPGSYTSGQAGYILSRITALETLINGFISRNIIKKTAGYVEVYRGDTDPIPFSTGINLTGKVVHLTVKRRGSDANADAILLDGDCAIVSASAGTVTYTPATTTFTSVGKYVYDLEVRDTDGGDPPTLSNPVTVDAGTFVVKQDVRL